LAAQAVDHSIRAQQFGQDQSGWRGLMAEHAEGLLFGLAPAWRRWLGNEPLAMARMKLCSQPGPNAATALERIPTHPLSAFPGSEFSPICLISAAFSR
jgi:hypothetical protein